MNWGYVEGVGGSVDQKKLKDGKYDSQEVMCKSGPGKQKATRIPQTIVALTAR